MIDLSGMSIKELEELKETIDKAIERKSNVEVGDWVRVRDDSMYEPFQGKEGRVLAKTSLEGEFIVIMSTNKGHSCFDYLPRGLRCGWFFLTKDLEVIVKKERGISYE